MRDFYDNLLHVDMVEMNECDLAIYLNTPVMKTRDDRFLLSHSFLNTHYLKKILYTQAN